jgi:hypothetical protein
MATSLSYPTMVSANKLWKGYLRLTPAEVLVLDV